jgi:hypothetical protein
MTVLLDLMDISWKALMGFCHAIKVTVEILKEEETVSPNG